MPISDLIFTAASRLKQARIPEPRLEAESLLAHVLKRDQAWLLAHADAAVSTKHIKMYAKLVAARARHVPFAYLVGGKWFYGRSFVVTKGVLIPRPETELLIKVVLDFHVGRHGKKKTVFTVLDIGAGSGAIGLTLASELPNSKAILCDISSKALTVARKNTKRLKLSSRVRFKKIDIKNNKPIDSAFGFTRNDDEPLILVANLPYLPSTTWKCAQPEVRLHEPKLALVSGQDGLNHYRALFKNVAQWKKKPELLTLEAEPGQFEELCRLAHAVMPNAEINILKDLHGDERVMVVENIRP